MILGAWYVLRTNGSPAWWPAMVWLYVPELAYPLVGIALSVAARKRRRLAALVLGSALLSGLAILPGASWQQADADFVIVSYNVRAQPDPRAVAQFLKEQGAHVAFLQEARPATGKTSEWCAVVAAELGSGWSFLHGSRETHDNDGEAIFSDQPMEPLGSEWLGKKDSAVLRARRGEMTLLNVHLSKGGGGPAQTVISTPPVLARQGADLARLVAAVRGPLIVAGDFNAPPSARPRLPLVDAQAGRGFGYTFPAGLPLWRIDAILASSSFDITSCRAVDGGLSDHLAVVARGHLRKGGKSGGR